MGMFDSVYIQCPDCRRKVEFQSKAGNCTLMSYDEDSVPEEIAYDIDGDAEQCDCGCTFSASYPYSKPKPIMVQVTGIKTRR